MSKSDKYCKSIDVNAQKLNSSKLVIWPKEKCQHNVTNPQKAKIAHKWPSNVPQCSTQPTIGKNLFNSVVKMSLLKIKRRH